MTTFDWAFMVLPLLLVASVGLYARRYMRSVVDFTSGGRVAGRYLLAVAGGEMQAGAVVFVATFEQISRSGFTLTWWRWLPVPILLFLTTFGFVGYRFRQTRALTLAQFFEIRYTKSFRVFTGLLGFCAGIANFGIIPAIGSRFFVYFLGMPETLHVGGFAVPTFVPVMAVLLSITTLMALGGGLITVMITDCVEGILSQLFYLAIIAALLALFRWQDIAAVLSDRPPGQSLLNPFDSTGLKDFNVWYVLIGLMTSVYGAGAWQNAGGYKSASLNPHEGRMSGLLGQWRELGKLSVVTLLAVCAVTFLKHPHYADAASPALSAINGIADGKVRGQMTVPVALSYLLPIGIKGMFCSILLLGVFGGDSTHLHSWGGIFVQDVLVPLRKKPFTPEQHIRVLRLGIVAVAVFAFIFGALFRQTEYIFMWWGVTQAIYMGGAGAVIIGGLYWKKGTAAGAWTAMITGSILAVGGILARQYWTDFPLNGAWISLVAMTTSLTLYVVVSLLTCRQDFNLDRMLHRGPYAAAAVRAGDELPPVTVEGQRTRWGRFFGFDEAYTRGDKWLASSLFIWSTFCVGLLVVGSIWNGFAPWSIAMWSSFWHVVGVAIPVVFTVVTGLWFSWGGVRDIRRLFRRLAERKVTPLDDGTVVGHRNLDEVVAGPAGATVPAAVPVTH